MKPSTIGNIVDRTKTQQVPQQEVSEDENQPEDPVKRRKLRDTSSQEGRSKPSSSKSSSFKSTSSEGSSSKSSRLEQESPKLSKETATPEKIEPIIGDKQMGDLSHLMSILDDSKIRSEITPPKKDASPVSLPEETTLKLDRVLPLSEIAQGISNMKKQERPNEAIGYTPMLSSLYGNHSEPPFRPRDPLPLSHVDLLDQMPLAAIVPEISAGVAGGRTEKKSEYHFVLDRVLERNEGLRLTGLNNIIYLPSPDDLPNVDSGTINLRGVRNLPARLQINQSGERILYIALNPSNAIDPEPTLLGEVKV
jgi:hypothetical protein